MYDLLALGEILLRLSPPDNERLFRGDIFEKQIGGAELNVASGAAQLGLRSGIISRIPDTVIGAFARNKLRFCGVSDEYLAFDGEKDGRLGIYFYENGAHPRKPGVVYDRGHSSVTRMEVEEFPEAMFRSARCFHTSGITLALGENCRKAGIRMIQRFKEQGAVISFDVNFRGNLWTGEEARECIEGILPYVDIFFCSEDTARLTFGREGDVRAIMKSFARDYPLSVIASTQRMVHSPKVHSFTSVIYDVKKECFYEEDGYRNIEVVDRIGSGDAYVAGVLYGLLSEGGNCQRALEYGNASGAVKNTIPGDMPSLSLRELQGIIEDHKNSGYHSEMKR